MHKNIYFAVIATATFFCGDVFATGLRLVENRASDYCIYLSPKAPSSVQLAASELREYIEKATGVSLPVIKKARPPAYPYISLGVNVASTAADIDAAAIPLEGYQIATRGKNIFILGVDTPDGKKTTYGGTSDGTLNGVYTFLEEFAGVRWLMPGEVGEYVPHRDALDIPQIDRVDKPGFPSRKLEYVQNDNPLVKQWLRRQKQGHSIAYFHGHNWVETMPADLFKTHPEWFAMIGGVRSAPVGRYKFETTNKELVQDFSDRVIDTLRKNPQFYSFSISPSDGDNWSTSPESLVLYDKDPHGALSMTRLVLDFYNNVARNVGRKMPNRVVCGYVYSSYQYPPSTGIPKLEPSLCLVVAPTFSYGYGLYRPEARADFEKIMKAWSRSTANLGYYDLPVTFQQTLGAPNPPGIEILKFIYPRLASYGAKEVYIYGVSGWGQGAITNYLLANLNWNPKTNVDDLAKEFYTLAYGPKAGPVMAQFYGLLDSATKKYHQAHPEANYTLNRELLQGIYVPIFPELEKLYAQAQMLATEPKQQLRLRMLQMNLAVFRKYLRMQKLIEENRQSPFYKNDADIAQFLSVSPYDVKFSLDPESIQAPELPLDAITVLPSDGHIRNSRSTENFLLRGQSRVVLYPSHDGEVTVSVSELTLAEDWARYTIRNREGTVIEKGDISSDRVLRFKASARQIYFLDIYADSARYHLKVDGARFAIKTGIQERGLHFYKKLTPLYFYVPAGIGAFSVTVVSDQAGKSVTADLISPSGEVAGSMDTKGRLVDSVRVNGQNAKPGFWSIVWKTPWWDSFEDVWVQLGKKLEPWVMVDTDKRLIVEPASH